MALKVFGGLRLIQGKLRRTLAFLGLVSVVIVGLDQYQRHAYKARNAENCATPAVGHFSFKLDCVAQPAEGPRRR